jgi:hypothetical protein
MTIQKINNFSINCGKLGNLKELGKKKKIDKNIL